MSNFDPSSSHPRPQALPEFTQTSPSVSSLVAPHLPASAYSSTPGTAATSMLTVVPMDDEKQPASTSQGMVTSADDSHPDLTEQQSEAAQEAEGLSVQTQSIPVANLPSVPQASLTFLLVSGKRRTMSFEPETTVGRVKELVWNAWPSEWQDEKPPAPNYLRILYLGKILQDEDTLSKLGIPITSPPNPSSPSSPSSNTAASPTSPTIVHLSIRPYAPLVEDEATLKKKARAARRALTRSASGAPGTGTGDGQGAGAEDREAGCCSCVIC